MSEYIKDYFRVSKLIMHYNKYNRMIKYGFALILIAFGGNLQWAFMITAMIFTYLAVPVAFDGVGFILPLTDEERTKRRLTGALIPMLELSLCAALGKVIRYILVCNGILGTAETSVLVRYPVFSTVFFMTSVIAAADISLDAVLGIQSQVIFNEKETKTLIKEWQFIEKLILQGFPTFVFILYAFVMCVDFKWIYQLDDMGNIKHLLRLLVAIILFIIHIILTIHRYLKECRDFY